VAVTHPQISVATAEDRDAVVATFVAAFAGDPAVRYFLPDDETYPVEAAKLGGQLFDSRVGHGTVWIADGGVAVAMWDPPRRSAPPTPSSLPALPGRSAKPNDHLPLGSEESGGGGPANGGAANSGVGNLDRFGRYQAVVHKATPQFPHWYLGVLAAHPDHWGRRLGRTVMAAGLVRAAEDGLPAYLETSTPKNVDVYRSAGFDVAKHLMVDELPVWIMSRPPGAP
jgi:GNAT superfamily N-acetyltransferase